MTVPAMEVSRKARWACRGHGGATVWLTGFSGAGKSTIAMHVEMLLLRRGIAAYQLDADVLRRSLNRDLGFSPNDRRENVRRVGEVARLFADAGVVAVVPIISPYARDRAQVRSAHEESSLVFCECWVATPLEVCERRDPKGLYRRARVGDLTEFTGVSAPYEPPEAPELTFDDCISAGAAATAIVRFLIDTGAIPAVSQVLSSRQVTNGSEATEARPDQSSGPPVCPTA
jgi:bifunctional enzyme CysN/CysC